MPPPRPGPVGGAVPTGRLSRLVHFGGMAGGVAGSMLLDGARQLAGGKRPSVADLLLTPGNALKVTRHLANLRGAAMKMGQLLSMDGGDILPPELTQILGALRSDARPMPPAQLQTVLGREWGRDWRTRFERFEVRPLAAASIGQVHRARTRDGRDLAIKIQYPGVRASIDSDVDNVASLIRLSGMLPAGVAIAPLLAEAKRQLHEEADYAREAQCLAEFGLLLAGSADFRVPGLHADLSTRNVLAMDFAPGVAIEARADAPQAERDRIMTLLVELVLNELFDFGTMQTDPNFANYRYDPATARIVLLDFGATRAFAPEIAAPYRQLAAAGFSGDRGNALAAILATGLLGPATPDRHRDMALDLFELAMAPIRATGSFDFGRSELVEAIRDRGLEAAADRTVPHIPPIDALFLQRKFAGLFLLGTRLKARVDVRALLAPHLTPETRRVGHMTATA